MINRRKTIFIFMRIKWFFFEQNWYPSPKGALCQVWLKLAPWRRNFLISIYLRYFVIISPWKRVGPLYWTNLNLLHPRIHCAKFGWNWLSSSWEEDFLISSVYFRYFLIISLWKRVWPFIWTKLNPLHPGCFVPSLVEIGSVVLEKKIF